MDTIEQSTLTKENFQKFQHIIELQQQAIDSAHQRTSFLSKVVIAGFFLVLMGSVFISYAMSSQLVTVTDTMKDINHSMLTMSKQMHKMHKSMNVMHGNMQAMVPMIQKIDKMTATMQLLSEDTVGISEYTASMNQNMQHVRSDMNKMNQSIYTMRGHINQMDKDVYNISQPMRIFNRMNPFQ